MATTQTPAKLSIRRQLYGFERITPPNSVHLRCERSIYLSIRALRASCWPVMTPSVLVLISGSIANAAGFKSIHHENIWLEQRTRSLHRQHMFPGIVGKRLSVDLAFSSKLVHIQGLLVTKPMVSAGLSKHVCVMHKKKSRDLKLYILVVPPNLLFWCGPVRSIHFRETIAEVQEGSGAGMKRRRTRQRLLSSIYLMCE